MILRRVGKPVKVASVLYAVIAENEAQALFPNQTEAELWRSANYKSRSDVHVEAVRFDEQKGAG